MTTGEHGLGRIQIPDERDRGFLMSAAVAEAPKRRWRYWNANGWWGDQGATSQCVAYSLLHMVADGPVTTKGVADPVMPPRDLYQAAQRIDAWPGENYDGTSVRAGAKVLQDAGWISEYRWAWDVDTVVRALLDAGPVVVGTTWHDDMFTPDGRGFVHATGRSAGGHAYVLNGVNTDREVVRLKNSWGREWGLNGHAWLSFRDLEQLIKDYGEACLPIRT